MTIKLIGAGFGRTGTSSLKDALEQIGFGKCYHMRELIEHREHLPLWQAAITHGTTDWDRLFAGYQSTVDWPGCTFYQDLMRHYPDAKVLLSVRDPERWYTSAANTIFLVQKVFPRWLAPLLPGMGRFVQTVGKLVWDGTFDGRFADKQHAIEVFNRHNEEVKRVVPPEKLLVYDVKQGWEPLCHFLEVPVPSTPFPHLNDTAEFQRMFQRRNQVLRAGMGAALLLALLGGRLAWQRATRPA